MSTSDRTAQGTLYLTQFRGNQIGLFDGSYWWLRSNAEVSLALSGLTDAKIYDVFAYWTGSAIALELSQAWTNDTTRADALTRQNGVVVKSGTPTRRHVGTIRTTGTATTQDSATRRYVWNRDNQVTRPLATGFVDNSHSYSGAAWREWNNGSFSVRLQWVCGDAVAIQSGVGGEFRDGGYLGVGVDSTTSPLGLQAGNLNSSNVRSGVFNAASVAAGYHYAAVLEFGTGSAVLANYGHSMSILM